jgi:hypothetical protein
VLGYWNLELFPTVFGIIGPCRRLSLGPRAARRANRKRAWCRGYDTYLEIRRNEHTANLPEVVIRICQRVLPGLRVR